MEKGNEKKVLAIIALVFAILGIVLSWVPILNNVGMVFAVIGLILGVIALLRNLKVKKTISLVATILSVIAMVIVLATQSFYGKAIDKAGKSVSSAMSSSQKEDADNFKWTQSEFDSLTVGDTISGVGGANYDEIVAKFGDPETKSDTQSGDYTMRSATWSKMVDGTYSSVDLSFIQQDDGSYLLSMKNASSLN